MTAALPESLCKRSRQFSVALVDFPLRGLIRQRALLFTASLCETARRCCAVVSVPCYA